MEMSYEEVKKTNEVSLAHLTKTINIFELSNMVEISNESISVKITAKLGNAMNCVGLKAYDISHDIYVTLKIYPIKIRMLAKQLNQVENIVKNIRSILDNNIDNILYDIHIHGKKITINLCSMPSPFIYHMLDVYSDSNMTDIEYKPCKIHATGLKSPESWDYILSKLLPLFKENMLTDDDTKIDEVYYIMSNCKYNIGFKIALWELVSNIHTIEGFENAICLYDNLRKAHEAIIILPLKDNPNILSKMWRNNIEASFNIRNTGSVRQSCPSDETGKIAYDMFKDAIVNLEHLINRTMYLTVPV